MKWIFRAWRFVIFMPLIVALVSYDSVFSFFYFGLISLALGKFVFKATVQESCSVYVIFTVITLILYGINLANFPSYHGLTGPEGGIGTDDVRFFFHLNVSDEILAMPSRAIPFDHPYVILLQVIYPFEVRSLLTILFANSIAASLLFFGTRGLASKLLNDSRIGQYASFMVLICPFIINNNNVLIRDGWIAGLVVSACFLFARKSYLYCFCFAILAVFLRPASVAILAVFIFGTHLSLLFQRGHRVTIGQMLMFLLAFALLLSGGAFIYLSSDKYELGRQGFVDSYYARGSDTSMLALQGLPIYLKVFLLPVYFFVIPVVDLVFIKVTDIFLVRRFFVSLFAVLNTFYVACFCLSVTKSLQSKNWPIIIMSMMFIASLVMLSFGSLQFRHKVMVMPFYYVIVAHGFSQFRRRDVSFVFYGAFFVMILLNAARA